MSSSRRLDVTAEPVTLTPRADQECDRFEAAWKAGTRPRLEDHLAAVPEVDRPGLLRELLMLEIDYRCLAGEHPGADEYLARFPSLDRAWLLSVLSRSTTPAARVDPSAAAGPAVSDRLGKFLLLAQIGKGGCGTVWRAHDTELDRIVAVKVPDPGLMTSPMMRQRFCREARAAARLCHPNVVTLFDVVQVGATPLLVMEYVEGTDLQRLVEQSGPLSVGQACEWIRQASLGLQHAHERGLIHRDVKPSNLLHCTPESVIKVADLGLVRMLRGPDEVDTGLTEPGCVMGTADFMAPEQARDSRHADARSDIYSLGCTLYYLLTARVPFPGGSVTEKMLRHLSEVPPPLEELQPAVPPALAAVVRKMMAKRPQERHQSAADLLVALGGGGRPAQLAQASPRAAATRAPKAPAATAILPPPRRMSRRRLFVLLVSLLAVLGLVLLLRPWPSPHRTPDPPERTPEPFLTNSISMKLARIGAGKFWRGSPPDEPGRWVDEGPLREVQITRAFYIGVCEVTQQQFETVLHYNPSHFTQQRGGGPDHPVESLSHDEALRFCRFLSDRPGEKQAGRVYRLPTEAEWEYACRAGSRSAYHFGDFGKELWRYAWFAESAGGKTHPVGQLLPNAWELHDTHGNVFEWCSDWYDKDFYRDGPLVDPHCIQPTRARVVRGGCWADQHGDRAWCRSARRGWLAPNGKKEGVGLRVVLEVADPR